MSSQRSGPALVFLAGMVATGLLALAWAVGSGSSEAQQNSMHNCPQAGKWAIAVWHGDEGTDAGEAFATCGEEAVAVAYSIDPGTQTWSRWFADRPEITNLTSLDNLQGVIALGAVGAPPPTATSTPSGRIAFDCERDGNVEICLMNADGTGLKNLTNNSAGDWIAAWSPDGSQIAFTSGRDGMSTEVYVMNADGTGQIRLTSNPGHDISPAWSPDGSQIAFESEREGNSEIYVMNPDGTGQTNLTNNPSGDHKPAWSPDGSHFAFHSYRDGQFEIYVMDADGTNQTGLTNDPAPDLNAAWSLSDAQGGTIYNCPRPGKWAISVWNGPDTVGVDQALATCGAGAVAAAYYVDPQTQVWLRWFRDRPQISNLATVDDMQGLIVLGDTQAPASQTPTPPGGDAVDAVLVPCCVPGLQPSLLRP